MTQLYSAKHYAKKAEKWAVGTQEDCPNGSAKHWAQVAGETLESMTNVADCDLSNLTDTGNQKLVSEAVETLLLTDSTVTLEANKVYKMTLASDVTFSLPTTVASNMHNQIKVFANLTNAIQINFGTDTFFNAQVPDVQTGSYEFYFDYDPNKSVWVAGALKTGSAT